MVRPGADRGGDTRGSQHEPTRWPRRSIIATIRPVRPIVLLLFDCGRFSRARYGGMLIGIDARNLLFPLSGLGRFLTGAILEFERRGEDIHLFLPSPPTGNWAQSARDLTARIPTSISASASPAARAAWGQFTLPALARRAGVSLLWGPAHRLPRFGMNGLAKVLTVPDLVWRHAPGTMRRRTLWGERALMRQAVASADQITTVSQATRADLMAQFQPPAGRVRCVYPGVGPLPAPEDGGAVRRHGLTRPYALFVGTPEPRKNLARLIAAYRALAPDQRAACMLVIVGGGGWGDVDPTALARGMEEDIRVLGHVGDTELSALLAGARFLAMPSLYEGFGLPIIEANAFGVPVLTSSVASMRFLCRSARYRLHQAGTCRDDRR
mgnify:FL=1